MIKDKVSEEEIFILQKMIEGDEDAFKYFFDTYYDDLCNYVNIYLRKESLSEDIVQNIFIYLWEKKSSLNLKNSVKSYLYSASKNKSLNHLRNIKNQSRIAKEHFSQSDTATGSTDQYLEFEELRSIVSQAVDRLPARCKKIYQLSRDREMTHKEIAEELGISVKTVENQITIAIKKIKDFLELYYDQIFMSFILSFFF